MMKPSDFDYYLPSELIAQEPLVYRDKSRLLVLDRKTQSIKHTYFEKLSDFLNSNDLLILNNSEVIPARFLGEKEKTCGKVEVLLLKRLTPDTWEVLVNPSKRVKIGTKIIFQADVLKGEVIKINSEGSRIIKFLFKGSFENVLKKIGQMPTPPYIKKHLKSPERYQTIYAKVAGSVAAPTAGFHFTKKIFQKLNKKNIKRAFLTLHIGLGTFQPVKARDIKDHQMQEEYFLISKKSLDVINQAKSAKKRIITVGTTTVRALETSASLKGILEKESGRTNLFIYPCYKFKITEGLLTNFHLPKSTLFILVCAFAGRDLIFKAYKEAIEKRYRFYSFGDCMLII